MRLRVRSSARQKGTAAARGPQISQGCRIGLQPPSPTGHTGAEYREVRCISEKKSFRNKRIPDRLRRETPTVGGDGNSLYEHNGRGPSAQQFVARKSTAPKESPSFFAFFRKAESFHPVHGRFTVETPHALVQIDPDRRQSPRHRSGSSTAGLLRPRFPPESRHV